MSEWINLVKKVQNKYGCSYKDAMIKASELKRHGEGGRMEHMVGGPRGTWQLSPEQQRQYIEDKKTGRHSRKIGTATFWDPTYEGGDDGGLTWQLTPEQQRQYIEDKKTGRHSRKIGDAYFWDPTYEGSGDDEKYYRLFKSPNKNIKYASEREQVRQYKKDMYRRHLPDTDENWTNWLDANIEY